MFTEDLEGRILSLDPEAADAHSLLASARHQAGRLVSRSDAPIAAIALSRGAAAATPNIAEFSGAGLTVANPWDDRAWHSLRARISCPPGPRSRNSFARAEATNSYISQRFATLTGEKRPTLPWSFVDAAGRSAACDCDGNPDGLFQSAAPDCGLP
jgi:hypothetical protein